MGQNKDEEVQYSVRDKKQSARLQIHDIYQLFMGYRGNCRNKIGEKFAGIRKKHYLCTRF